MQMLSLTMSIPLTNSSSRRADFSREPSGVGFGHLTSEPLHSLLTNVRDLTRWAGLAIGCALLLQNFANVANLRWKGWKGRRFALEWTRNCHAAYPNSPRRDSDYPASRGNGTGERAHRWLLVNGSRRPVVLRKVLMTLERICDFGDTRDVQACRLPEAYRNGVCSAAFTFCSAYPTLSGADASNLGAVCDLVKDSWL
jgi:hypothetical protein